ncbi:MAG: sugar-binding protein [Verrucomicrobiae bacterium]|nr:sugar-binding protein [Verrucomicrobiae bacterium]
MKNHPSRLLAKVCQKLTPQFKWKTVARLSALLSFALIANPGGARETLVAHWTMDEIEDGIIKDQSGHGNDARVAGELPLVDGKKGKAACFDGNGANHLWINPSKSLDNLTEFSIEGWLKFDDLFALDGGKDNYPTFINRGSYQKSYPSLWIFAGFHSKNKTSLKRMGIWFKKPEWKYVGGHYSKALEWEKDRWYLLRAEFSANERCVRFFRDGEPAGAGEIPPDYHFGSGKIFLGSHQGEKGAWGFKGCMDEVKIFDRQIETKSGSVIRAAKLTGAPPAMDGSLSSPAWKQAVQTGDYKLNGKPDVSAKKQTAAWLLYDKKNLYLGFKLSEPEPEKIKAKFKEHNSPVWEDDSVEIFISPETKGLGYYHFIVNSLGAKADEKNSRPEKLNPNWNGQWTATAGKTRDAWTLEVTIPFETLELKSPPAEGDVWRVSLNRHETILNELSGWPNGFFHRPDQFGLVVFGAYKSNLQRQTAQLDRLIDEINSLTPSLKDTDLADSAQKDLTAVKEEKLQLQEEIASCAGDFKSQDWVMLNGKFADLSRQLKRIKFEVKGSVLLNRLTSKSGGMTAKEKLALQKEWLELDEECKDAVSFKETKLLNKLKSQYWLALSGKPYLCWRKNPWTNLAIDQFPDLSSKECRSLEAVMGGNEYETLSFVLTNFTTQKTRFRLKAVGGENISMQIRAGFPVKAKTGEVVNDALPLANELDVPPLQSREVWLTLRSRQAKPGAQNLTLSIDADGMPSATIAIKALVQPISLPTEMKDIPLYNAVWDYLNWGYDKIDVPFAEACKQDLLAHYNTVPFLAFSAIPWPKFDKDGAMKVDYTRFDRALEFWGKDCKILGSYWNFNIRKNFPGPQQSFGKDNLMDEQWKKNFAPWYKEFIAHIKSKGLDYKDFFFHTFDETTDPAYAEFLTFAKSLDSQVKLYANVTGVHEKTNQETKAMSPYVDIWCPWMSVGAAYNFDLMKTKGDFYWGYHNPRGQVYRLSPPYIDYRLPFWLAWKHGMRGCGMWVYCVHPDLSWNEYETQKVSHDMIYLSRYAPDGVCRDEIVIPSKRWEAWREGAEDYMYLDMLKNAIARKEAKAGSTAPLLAEARQTLAEWPEKVLREKDDPDLANQARAAIIEMIVKLN